MLLGASTKCHPDYLKLCRQGPKEKKKEIPGTLQMMFTQLPTVPKGLPTVAKLCLVMLNNPYFEWYPFISSPEVNLEKK